MDPLITNEHLHALFGKFGQIVSARVISHPTTKQSRGYGFVSFSTEDEAARAQEGMNGQVVFSKPLYVSFHEPKKNRTINNTSNNNYNNTNTNTVDINTNNNNLTGYAYHHSNADENNRSDTQRDINSSMDPSFYQQQQPIASPVVNLPRKQDLALEQCYRKPMVQERPRYFTDFGIFD
jgi:RNA recognition motif-containing protein